MATLLTADDVVSSGPIASAPSAPTSPPSSPPDNWVVVVDDYTVDFITASPNPILITQWDGWYIMDKKWCEANNAVAPTPVAATSPSYASLHENGTGPFTIESHQPGVKTVFKPFAGWWGQAGT